jgi:hypothetical protein
MTVEVDLHIKLTYVVWFWKIPLPKNTTIKSYVQTTFLKYRQWVMGRNFQTQSLTVLMLRDCFTAQQGIIMDDFTQSKIFTPFL